MAHVRQQIRESVATIVGGLTTTGTNVFQSRVWNVQESELPCLLIYTNDETIDDGTLNDLVRRLTLTLEGKAQVSTTLDDTLDDIASEVEIAMALDITIGGMAVSSSLDSTSVELTSEGDQPIGSISLNYDVTYMTPNGNPTTVSL